jgi:DNA mismatch repair protein PMS2
VKLYDQGLEAIEVTDNGHGVPRSSRPYMAAKHATSKLRRFDDLYDDGGDDGDDCAPSLGFRGEALFCLANLSRSLVVSTRTVDDDDDETLGTQFRFDSDGRLLPESVRRVPLSYRSGTTVVIHGLFESLPVRRVDMRKRIKAQRMKLIKMMQGCECCF